MYIILKNHMISEYFRMLLSSRIQKKLAFVIDTSTALNSCLYFFHLLFELYSRLYNILIQYLPADGVLL